MRRHRRRAYSLLYVLAALPLVMVVATISTQIIDRALRAQRTATYQTVNDDAMRSLVHRLREDARQAVSAATEAGVSGKQLHLKSPNQTVTYEMRAPEMRRVVHMADETESATRWSFKNSDVAFHVETIGAGRMIAWVLFDQQFEITRGITRQRRLSAAVPLGIRGLP